MGTSNRALPFLLAIASPLLLAQQAAQLLALGPGQLLIAKPGLEDPNFNRSVILLIDHNPKGSLGLILNRKMDITLRDLLDDDQNHLPPHPVYRGGPVEPEGLMTLLRIHNAESLPPHARRIVGDVFFLASGPTLLDRARARLQPDRFRVYLGYAGWAPRQLDREIRAGAWFVQRATPELVFDPDPATLWKRLAEQSQMRFALRLPPSPW